MEYDIHSRQKGEIALDVAAIITDTTTVGNIIDTKDFEGLEFYAFLGDWTDGAFALILEDGDDSGLSDAATVSADNTIGVAASLGADNALTRIGYGGKKRFVRASIVSTSTSSGSDGVGAVAVLGIPKSVPVADQ